MCRPYEEAGVCKYAEKCQFAHGMHELRNLQRHPKYKTEYCRTFHSVGFCPYGPRCHFVHNEEDAPIQPRPTGNNGAFNGRTANNGTSGTGAQHPLPMSPPLSMSTGSDRASPTGSLSPTSSMASFPFPDQSSPMGMPMMYSSSSLQISPPASPPAMGLPITPPSTPTILAPTVAKPVENGGNAAIIEDSRLPIFNQISGSTLDAFKNLSM